MTRAPAPLSPEIMNCYYWKALFGDDMTSIFEVNTEKCQSGWKANSFAFHLVCELANKFADVYEAIGGRCNRTL